MLPCRLTSTATLFVITLLSGCATSTSNWSPPTSNTIQNSIVTSTSFDPTWDKLVRQLSSDFFVINNIDKASRLINISFSSNHPSEFVDCGRSVRTFKNARGEQRYEYATADSSDFTTTDNKGVAFNFRRTTKLDGRTNIYVAPEGSGTLVTVNTKYIVNLQVRAFTLDGGLAKNESYTWDLSTKQPYNEGEIQCNPTGSIERRILKFLE